LLQVAPIDAIDDWKAIDTTLGDFIDFDNNPDKGFSQWREFLEKVVMKIKNEEKDKQKDHGNFRNSI
jgi:hypothetical protein